MSEGPIDLFALDRDVRRASERVTRFAEMLRTKEGREAARSFDPFAGLRHTAGQTTYRSLEAAKPSILDLPLRAGLLRWVYELLQARIGQELTVDDADAAHTIDERIARPSMARANDDPAVFTTYAEACVGILSAPDPSRASIALDRAGELASRVAAPRKERRERRFEVARRLGLSHPSGLVTPTPRGTLVAMARSLLDRTEAIAAEILKDARRKQEVPWTAASAMHLALARHAGEGWPAHLGSRWLSDVFGALSVRPLDLRLVPKLAAPLGASSFLRAAAAWGFAVRTAGAPRSLPFALARDPYPISAHRFGFAFAAALVEPTFQRKTLGLPARLAASQCRALGTTMLLSARTLAMRFLLGDEHTDPGTFEELGVRVFGAPLPPSMRDAWPEPRIDEEARFVALLTADAFVRDLRSRFDEDWFRNPRAGVHLASIASGPAFLEETLDASSDVVAPLARSFEEGLG